jgi:phage tail sheath gpL-like
MTISMNQIPNNARTPYFYVEFDTSKAQQGAALQVYTALLIGQRLAAGTKPEGQIDLVTSESQAKQYYGAGSMLASMVASFLKDNKVTALKCIALDDLGAGVAATGDVLFGGASIKAGTLAMKIAGRRYAVGVSEGDTPAEVATALVAAITADADAQMGAAVNGGTPEQVDFTAKHKGVVSNEVDIRTNPESDDVLPENLTAVITGMSGGTGNPDIATAITAIGDIQFHVIGQPYTDATNLDALETELTDRFGPIRAIEGHSFTAKRESVANLITFGDGRNSPHVTTMGIAGPSNPWDWAANQAAVAAFYAPIDPARPFQTLAMTAIDAPKESELFTQDERNLLLNDGIATFAVDAGGVVRVERFITMFQENSFGSPDTSLLDANTLFTLSYLRFDFRAHFAAKYPRHKLADDGVRFGPGQAIITPLIGKAEAIAKFRQWEELGLVENIDQFKRDLIVERNAQDPNRLDFLLPPDLINQFRIGAAQIAFLL